MSKYSYPFKHYITFALVMQNEEFCKDIVDRILPDRKVKEVRFRESEKSVFVDPELKSVRMDVMFEDDEAWYDLEIQVRDERNLPKRSRYLHSINAVNGLKRGADYNSLKKSYVIFLCDFDYFGDGKALHICEMRDEKNLITLGDGCYTVIVNGRAEDESICEGLRNLLNYMSRDELAEGDRMLAELDREVASYNTGRGLQKIVTIYEKMEQERQEGLAEGLAKGRAEKELEMIRTMSVNGASADDIASLTDISIEEINSILNEHN